MSCKDYYIKFAVIKPRFNNLDNHLVIVRLNTVVFDFYLQKNSRFRTVKIILGIKIEGDFVRTTKKFYGCTI